MCVSVPSLTCDIDVNGGFPDTPIPVPRTYEALTPLHFMPPIPSISLLESHPFHVPFTQLLTVLCSVRVEGSKDKHE